MGKLKELMYEVVPRPMETEVSEALVWLTELREYPCPICNEATIFKLGHADCINAELFFGGSED